MNEVIQAAAELQAICQSQDWQFCFIGGLALKRWRNRVKRLMPTPEILDQLDARRIEFER
ncbi:MAG TPA: hypothetical protein VFS90_06365 [Pyrinomonadaceae bacterium]|nr:hypothetical protein [Pyrinomonadaceae bacterium]